MKFVDLKKVAPELQEMLSVIGTLAKRVDWNKQGQQFFEIKKGASIFVRRENNVIYIEFGGMIDMFGWHIALIRDGHNICTNNIGLGNDAVLHCPGFMPPKGLKLSVIPFKSLVE